MVASGYLWQSDSKSWGSGQGRSGKGQWRFLSLLTMTLQGGTQASVPPFLPFGKIRGNEKSLGRKDAPIFFSFFLVVCAY